MVQELDTVVITRDLPERGIVVGDIGIVAHLYTDHTVAEVEFVSGAGRDTATRSSLLAFGSYRRTKSEERSREHAAGESAIIAVETLSVDDIRPVGAREILHARAWSQS